MDCSRFNGADDYFEFEGFRIAFEWKTKSSISFQLSYGGSFVRHVFGWVDVHEAEEDPRVKIRVCVPHAFIKFKDCPRFVAMICDQLSLPADSFEADFVSPLKQILFEERLYESFTSYGESVPDDNGWDDRNGISPLEIISRERAFGMLMEAFPEFHRGVDELGKPEILSEFGGPFLDCGETIVLSERLIVSLESGDVARVAKVFEILERLAVYGDEYTRNGFLQRLCEYLRDGTSYNTTRPRDFERYMKNAMLAKWNSCGSL